MRGCALWCVAIVVGACGPPSSGVSPTSLRVIVRNAGSFDAAIYVVANGEPSSARVATITANTTKAVELRSAQIPASEVLQFLVRPIGTNASWTSGGVILQPGMIPLLDLPIGAGGDCSSCFLRVVPPR